MLSQPFAIPAAAFVVLSIPLVLGMVPPNRFYGVRTRRTFASKEVWYAANRFGGVAVAVASLVYFEVARLYPYTRGARDDLRLTAIHLVGWVVPLVVALIAVAVYIRRL